MKQNNNYKNQDTFETGAGRSRCREESMEGAHETARSEREREWWGGRVRFLTLSILVLFTFYKHGLVLNLTETIKIKNNKKLQSTEIC